MKNLKKKIFFHKIDEIIEKFNFVIFFQYIHLKNKQLFYFKNVLQKKNKIKFLSTPKTCLTKNKKLNYFVHTNMLICNNKLLHKYFYFKNKKNFKLSNISFFCQAPTVLIFFNNVYTLNFFFNSLNENVFYKNINNIIKNHFLNNCDENKQKKNKQEKFLKIFLQKNIYNNNILNFLFFTGAIYKNKVINFLDLKKICMLNKNIYNTLIFLWFVNIKYFFNIFSYIKGNFFYNIKLHFLKLINILHYKISK